MITQNTEVRRVECNGITISLEADLGAFEAALTLLEESQSGVFLVGLTLSAMEPSELPDLLLRWSLPSIDFHYKWNPRCFFNRGLDTGAGTENVIHTRANSDMPVYCLHNLDGMNACTWALSDAIHDISIGGHYGDGQYYRSLVKIAGASVGVVRKYTVTLRLDFRRVPYYEALDDVAAWWEAMDDYKPCAIPDAACLPVLSSWYSYKLDIDQTDWERQCATAKSMGMDTVILDDGWQTDQTEFGYQNNGDWEVCAAKLPDFAEHVKRVQAMGLKYMVWFSVPYVGVESKAYVRFKDMLLPEREGAQVYCLDPRFPETRAYLADTFERFVHRYRIDGIKMDFIGTFSVPRGLADVARPGHDCASLGEGVCKLLDDVMRRLKSFKPDFLIEFRQHYVGPAMRKYGNMFRAVDCPNSIGDNRIRTLDTRLMSRKTVVHSDPITWHDDDPDHSAAMQIIHALFSVPQIARKVTELSSSHRRMLTHQLCFCREHRDVLLQGTLRPLHPHQLYPLVIADAPGKRLAAFYSAMPLRLDEAAPDLLILVNGGYEDHLILDLSVSWGPVRVQVTNCRGEEVSNGTINLDAGLIRIAVPPAASAVITRVGQVGGLA